MQDRETGQSVTAETLDSEAQNDKHIFRLR